MLRIAVPHVAAWNSWYSSFGNTPEGIAPLRDLVDAACRDVGRDPAMLERTVAVQVRLRGGTGRDTVYSSATVEPLSGTPEELAGRLRSFAAAGIAHVQLVLDPITDTSIDAMAPVLALLDGG
jgi:alkanesulfonate monooxygenase SsuD/methylene tetrahydromethanopterin reductase-like flavin-dependent oxidoreductase (luciferase family)